LHAARKKQRSKIDPNYLTTPGASWHGAWLPLLMLITCLQVRRLQQRLTLEFETLLGQTSPK